MARGKTGPALLVDFIHFNVKSKLVNPLLYFPELPVKPSCEEGFRDRREGECWPHAYILLPDDSFMCSKCRQWAKVSISGGTGCRFDGINGNTMLMAHSFHHYIFEGRSSMGLTEEGGECSSTTVNGINQGQDEEIMRWMKSQVYFDFVCSFPGCQTHMKIEFREAALGAEHVKLLTTCGANRNHDIIGTLIVLRIFIQNAFNEKFSQRSIACENGFLPSLLSTHPNVPTLLHYLGFRKHTKDNGVSANNSYWMPPQATSEESVQNALLHTVFHELGFIIRNYSSLHTDIHRGLLKRFDDDNLAPAQNVLTQLFQYPDGQVGAKFAVLPVSGYYSCLGSLPGFNDDMILYALQRQLASDSKASVFYIEALQQIAQMRQSEYLVTQVAIFMSQGYKSWEEIRKAYEDLGFSESEALDKGRNEFNVLERFRTRQRTERAEDCEGLRASAQVIGEYLGSDLLLGEVKKDIESYDQALHELSICSTVSDEFVIASYVSMISDSKGNEVQKKRLDRALEIIAKARNSAGLRDYMANGSTENALVDWAYDYFRVTERNSVLDVEVLELTRDNFRLDRPLEWEKIDLAYDTLLKHNMQRLAKWNENTEGGIKVNYRSELESRPVGLQNIGNTCYLNSILQYLYTIKDLRDLVLNMSEYRANIMGREEGKVKRIGGRNVSDEEINRAIEFVEELSKLFEEMRTAKSGVVRPSRKLAILTFMRNTIKNDEIDSNGGEKMGEGKSKGEGEVKNDDEEVTKGEETTLKDGNIEGKLDMDKTGLAEWEMFHDTKELSRQQDVTEVMKNIFFQLEAAMKGVGVLDESGEQDDLIKRLFFMKVEWKRTNGGEKEELWNDVLIYLPDGPRTLYQAIDAEFDLQRVNLNGEVHERYVSLKYAPTIFQVNVCRVNFDSTRRTTFKVETYLQLEETLFLDRYINDTEGRILEKRRLTWAMKREIGELEVEQAKLTASCGPSELSLMETLQCTVDYVERAKGLCDEPDKRNALSQCRDTLRDTLNGYVERRASIREKIQELQQRIRNVWQDECKYAYKLYAVFMHRGLSNGGHYWIVIRDFRTGVWRKYDDTNVTTLTDWEEEIFKADSNWPTATPYFLVYVRAKTVDGEADDDNRDDTGQGRNYMNLNGRDMFTLTDPVYREIRWDEDDVKV